MPPPYRRQRRRRAGLGRESMDLSDFHRKWSQQRRIRERTQQRLDRDRLRATPPEPPEEPEPVRPPGEYGGGGLGFQALFNAPWVSDWMSAIGGEAYPDPQAQPKEEDARRRVFQTADDGRLIPSGRIPSRGAAELLGPELEVEEPPWRPFLPTEEEKEDAMFTWWNLWDTPPGELYDGYAGLPGQPPLRGISQRAEDVVLGDPIPPLFESTPEGWTATEPASGYRTGTRIGWRETPDGDRTLGAVSTTFDTGPPLTVPEIERQGPIEDQEGFSRFWDTWRRRIRLEVPMTGEYVPADEPWRTGQEFNPGSGLPEFTGRWSQRQIPAEELLRPQLPPGEYDAPEGPPAILRPYEHPEFTIAGRAERRARPEAQMAALQAERWREEGGGAYQLDPRDRTQTGVMTREGVLDEFKRTIQHMFSERAPDGSYIDDSIIEGPSAPYEDIITRESGRFGVRPELVRALIEWESGGRSMPPRRGQWDPKATSPDGAKGLMQLMPGTAQQYGVSDPYDPAQNIRAGVNYLRDLLEQFNNNEELALAAYNAGPGVISRNNGIPETGYKETKDYVPGVLRLLNEGPQVLSKGQQARQIMYDALSRDESYQDVMERLRFTNTTPPEGMSWSAPLMPVPTRDPGQRGRLEFASIIDPYSKPTLAEVERFQSALTSARRGEDVGDTYLNFLAQENQVFDPDAPADAIDLTPRDGPIDPEAPWLDRMRARGRQIILNPIPTVTDVGTSAVTGIGGAFAWAPIGLVDMLVMAPVHWATGADLRVSKFLEDNLGVTQQSYDRFYEQFYSDPQRRANQSLEETETATDAIKVMLNNPSTALHGVVQMLPFLAGVGGIARTVEARGRSMATRAGAVVNYRWAGLPADAARVVQREQSRAVIPMRVGQALSKTTPGGYIGRAAFGEGALTAGFMAQSIQEQTGEPLTPGQAAMITASGGLTAGISVAMGSLARTLGVLDVDTLVAGGLKETGSARNLLWAIPLGFVHEGIGEEWGQSFQERVTENLILGRPPLEGALKDGAIGAVIGGLTGAGAQAMQVPRVQRLAGFNQDIKRLQDRYIQSDTERAQRAASWYETGAGSPLRESRQGRAQQIRTLVDNPEKLRQLRDMVRMAVTRQIGVPLITLEDIEASADGYRTVEELTNALNLQIMMDAIEDKSHPYWAELETAMQKEAETPLPEEWDAADRKVMGDVTGKPRMEEVGGEGNRRQVLKGAAAGLSSDIKTGAPTGYRPYTEAQVAWMLNRFLGPRATDGQTATDDLVSWVMPWGSGVRSGLRVYGTRQAKDEIVANVINTLVDEGNPIDQLAKQPSVTDPAVARELQQLDSGEWTTPEEAQLRTGRFSDAQLQKAILDLTQTDAVSQFAAAVGVTPQQLAIEANRERMGTQAPPALLLLEAESLPQLREDINPDTANSRDERLAREDALRADPNSLRRKNFDPNNFSGRTGRTSRRDASAQLDIQRFENEYNRALLVRKRILALEDIQMAWMNFVQDGRVIDDFQAAEWIETMSAGVGDIGYEADRSLGTEIRTYATSLIAQARALGVGLDSSRDNLMSLSKRIRLKAYAQPGASSAIIGAPAGTARIDITEQELDVREVAEALDIPPSVVESATTPPVPTTPAEGQKQSEELIRSELQAEFAILMQSVRSVAMQPEEEKKIRPRKGSFLAPLMQLATNIVRQDTGLDRADGIIQSVRKDLSRAINDEAWTGIEDLLESWSENVQDSREFGETPAWFATLRGISAGLRDVVEFEANLSEDVRNVPSGTNKLREALVDTATQIIGNIDAYVDEFAPAEAETPTAPTVPDEEVITTDETTEETEVTTPPTPPTPPPPPPGNEPGGDPVTTSPQEPATIGADMIEWGENQPWMAKKADPDNSKAITKHVTEENVDALIVFAYTNKVPINTKEDTYESIIETLIGMGLLKNGATTVADLVTEAAQPPPPAAEVKAEITQEQQALVDEDVAATGALLDILAQTEGTKDVAPFKSYTEVFTSIDNILYPVDDLSIATVKEILGTIKAAIEDGQFHVQGIAALGTNRTDGPEIVAALDRYIAASGDVLANIKTPKAQALTRKIAAQVATKVRKAIKRESALMGEAAEFETLRPDTAASMPTQKDEEPEFDFGELDEFLEEDDDGDTLRPGGPGGTAAASESDTSAGTPGAEGLEGLAGLGQKDEGVVSQEPTLPEGDGGDTAAAGGLTPEAATDAGQRADGGGVGDTGTRDVGPDSNTPGVEPSTKATAQASAEGTPSRRDWFAILYGDRPQEWKARVESALAVIELSKTLAAHSTPPTLAQKEILLGFQGWANLFRPAKRDEPGWGWTFGKSSDEVLDNVFRNEQEVQRKLRELLTPEQIQALVANAQLAQQPPPGFDVPTQMWRILEAFGFAGGKVLDPAAGTGNFFGTMPAAFAFSRLAGAKTTLTGVVRDEMQAQIARQLYGFAEIKNEHLEQSSLEPNTYDLVIGQAPIAGLSREDYFDWRYTSLPSRANLQDPAFETRGKERVYLHDYYIAKSIDMAREGGLIALIVPADVMDRRSQEFRREIDKKAHFLHAIRLPREAFPADDSANPAQRVDGEVSDILFLKKRAWNETTTTIPPLGLAAFDTPPNWLNSTRVNTSNIETGDGYVNEYFSVPDFVATVPIEVGTARISRVGGTHGRPRWGAQTGKEARRRGGRWDRTTQAASAAQIFPKEREPAGVEDAEKLFDQTKEASITMDVLGYSMMVESDEGYRDAHPDARAIGEEMLKVKLQDTGPIIAGERTGISDPLLAQDWNNNPAIVPRHPAMMKRIMEATPDVVVYNEDRPEPRPQVVRTDREYTDAGRYRINETVRAKAGQDGLQVLTIDGEWVSPKFPTKTDRRRAVLYTRLAAAYLHFLRGSYQTVQPGDVSPPLGIIPLKQRREELNTQYDAFVKKFGRLHDLKNQKLILGDPVYGAQILGLELTKVTTKPGTNRRVAVFARKSPILLEGAAIKQFALPQENSIHDVDEALTWSLRLKGGVDPAYIQAIYQPRHGAGMDMTWDQIVAAMASHKRGSGRSPRIFFDPQEQNWQLLDQYLSGDVVGKLAAAREAARTNPKFRDNVEALEGPAPGGRAGESVQPARIEPDRDGSGHGFRAPFGAPWVPTRALEAFLNGVNPDPKEQGQVSLTNINSGGRFTWFVRRVSVTAPAHWKPGTARGRRGWPTETPTPLAQQLVPTDILEEWGNGGANDFAGWVQDALNQRIKVITKKEDVLDADGNQVLNSKGKVLTRRVRDEGKTQLYNDSLQRLRDSWDKWWLDVDETAQLLTDVYNNKFNRWRQPTYDGSYLEFAGMMKGKSLRDFQRDAVARQIRDGNTLLAWDTGAGKTLTMIASAMEYRRLGLAHKPMLAAPSHVVEQHRITAQQYYPAANILTLSAEDFSPKRREATGVTIREGDWDLILVGHPQFTNSIQMGEGTLEDWAASQQEELIEIVASETPRMTSSEVRQMVRTRRAPGGATATRELRKTLSPTAFDAMNRIVAWDRKLNRRRAKREKKRAPAAPPLDFAGLKVDMLIVDEAHEFKNLWYSTTKSNVVGAGSPDSNQALDMYLKLRHINEQSNYRNVMLATATPISRSLGEAYTFMRMLNERDMKHQGIDAFDAWASTFASAITQVEPAPGGGYTERTRLKDWKNLRELSRMFKKNADVMTPAVVRRKLAEIAGTTDPETGMVFEPVNLPVPKVHLIESAPHPKFAEYMQGIKRRLDTIAEIGTLAAEDNILNVMGDVAKAAIQLDMVMPEAEIDEVNGRLPVAARKIHEVWKATEKDRGAQIVFLQMGTPKALGELPDAVKNMQVSDDEVAEADALVLEEEFRDKEELKAQQEQASEAKAEQQEARQGGEDADVLGMPVYDELASPSDQNQDATVVAEQGEGLVDLYAELKRRLEAMNIPADQIVFNQQLKTSEDRAKLYKAVNEGKVRIFITSKETGINVQSRLAALHHLDVPYNPHVLVQREGRIVRQGNLYKNVDIFRYVTERSFDEFRWNLVAEKQRFISWFMDGDINVFDDLDAASLGMAEASAIASGDRRTLEYVRNNTELKGLTTLYETWKRRVDEATVTASKNSGLLAASAKRRAHAKILLAELDQWKKSERHVTLKYVPIGVVGNVRWVVPGSERGIASDLVKKYQGVFEVKTPEGKARFGEFLEEVLDRMLEEKGFYKHQDQVIASTGPFILTYVAPRRYEGPPNLDNNLLTTFGFLTPARIEVDMKVGETMIPVGRTAPRWSRNDRRNASKTPTEHLGVNMQDQKVQDRVRHIFETVETEKDISASLSSLMDITAAGNMKKTLVEEKSLQNNLEAQSKDAERILQSRFDDLSRFERLKEAVRWLGVQLGREKHPTGEELQRLRSESEEILEMDPAVLEHTRIQMPHDVQQFTEALRAIDKFIDDVRNPAMADEEGDAWAKKHHAVLEGFKLLKKYVGGGAFFLPDVTQVGMGPLFDDRSGLEEIALMMRAVRSRGLQGPYMEMRESTIPHTSSGFTSAEEAAAVWQQYARNLGWRTWGWDPNSNEDRLEFATFLMEWEVFSGSVQDSRALDALVVLGILEPSDLTHKKPFKAWGGRNKYEASDLSEFLHEPTLDEIAAGIDKREEESKRKAWENFDDAPPDVAPNTSEAIYEALRLASMGLTGATSVSTRLRAFEQSKTREAVRLTGLAPSDFAEEMESFNEYMELLETIFEGDAADLLATGRRPGYWTRQSELSRVREQFVSALPTPPEMTEPNPDVIEEYLLRVARIWDRLADYGRTLESEAWRRAARTQRPLFEDRINLTAAALPGEDLGLPSEPVTWRSGNAEIMREVMSATDTDLNDGMREQRQGVMDAFWPGASTDVEGAIEMPTQEGVGGAIPITAAEAKKLQQILSNFGKRKARDRRRRRRPNLGVDFGYWNVEEGAQRPPTEAASQKWYQLNRSHWNSTRILRELEKATGIRAFAPQGSMPLSKRVHGTYQPAIGVIRLQSLAAVEVMAHEWGHHLGTKILGIRKEQMPWTQELLDLGARTSLPTYQLEQVLMEGEAEFFRKWLGNKHEVKRSSPLYYAAFETALDHLSGEDAVLGAGLRTIQEELHDFHGGTDIEKSQGMMAFDDPGDRGEGSVAGGPGLKGRAAGYVERMERMITQRFAPLRNAVEQLSGGRAPDNIMDDAFRLMEQALVSSSKSFGFVRFGVKNWRGERYDPGDRGLAGAIANIERLDTIQVKGLRQEMDPDAALVDATPGATYPTTTVEHMHKVVGHAAIMRHFSHYLLLSHLAMDWKRLDPSGTRGGVGPWTNQAQVVELMERYEHIPEFVEARDKVHRFSDALLTYAQEGGVLSAEQVENMRNAYVMYMPMQRIQDEIAGGMGGSRFGLVSARQSEPSSFKGRTARGARAILDPLESLLRNTNELVAHVETNLARQAFVRQVRNAQKASLAGMSVNQALGGKDPTALKAGETYTGIESRILPGQFAIGPLPSPLSGTSFNLEQVQRTMKDIFGDAIAELSVETEKDRQLQIPNREGTYAPGSLTERQLERIMGGLDFNELVTIFTPATYVNDKQRMISVLEDGKSTWWRITNEALYQTLTGVPPAMGLFAQKFWFVTAGPARLLRATATATPEFALRNLSRDTLSAFLFSRYGFVPIYHTIKGLWHVMRQDEMYELFLNSKAGGHSIVSADRDYLREEMRALGMGTDRQLIRGLRQLKEMEFDDATRFIGSIPKSAYGALKAFQEALENASRIGEFELGLGVEGEALGGRTFEAIHRAAYSAAEVTVNFRRGGELTLRMNQYTAFLNAGIQGKVRIAEVAKRDPVGFMARGSMLSMASMLLLALNWEDEDYWELPDWDRKSHWHLRRGTNQFGKADWIRFPKPWDLGDIFGNLPEAVVEFWADEMAIKQGLVGKRGVKSGKLDGFRQIFFPLSNDPFYQTASAALSGMLPTVLLPMVELFGNYSAFLGRPIENEWETGLDPQFRGGPWTSPTAHKLARYAPAGGPNQWEHLITGYTAGIGRAALSLVDLIQETPPARQQEQGPERWAGVRALYTTSLVAASSESVNKFYRLRDKINLVLANMREFKAVNNQTEVDRLYLKWQHLLDREPLFAAANRKMGELQTLVAQTLARVDIDPARRTTDLSMLYGQLVDTSREALGLSPIYEYLYRGNRLPERLGTGITPTWRRLTGRPPVDENSIRRSP